MLIRSPRGAAYNGLVVPLCPFAGVGSRSAGFVRRSRWNGSAPFFTVSPEHRKAARADDAPVGFTIQKSVKRRRPFPNGGAGKRAGRKVGKKADRKKK